MPIWRQKASKAARKAKLKQEKELRKLGAPVSRPNPIPEPDLKRMAAALRNGVSYDHALRMMRECPDVPNLRTPAGNPGVAFRQSKRSRNTSGVHAVHVPGDNTGVVHRHQDAPVKKHD